MADKKIDLTRVLLINWYGFHYEIIPFDKSKTYIGGVNQSGKTTILDAIRYAAYGDPVFNVSSGEKMGKKGRTLSSYTLCKKSESEGYYRNEKEYGTVFTHIALEYYNEDTGLYHVNDTMIETKSETSTETKRFSFPDANHPGDSVRLEDINFFGEAKEKDGSVKKYLYDFREFSENNGKALAMNKKDGLARFMQMNGLRLSDKGIANHARDFRNVVTYDPNARVDRYIKDSVLEVNNVDLSSLRDSKDKVLEVGKTLERVSKECSQLEKIEEIADEYRMYEDRIIRADIKYAYKDYASCKKKYDEACETALLENEEIRRLEERRQDKEKDRNDANDQLISAKAQMQNLSSTAQLNHQGMILDQKKAEAERLDRLFTEARAKALPIRKIAERSPWLDEKQEEILANILGDDLPSLERRRVLMDVRSRFQERKQKTEEDRAISRIERDRILGELREVNRALSDIEKRNYVPAQAKEYQALRDAINEELGTRGINADARMAYEFVEEIVDEQWRPVIENKLGNKRFTVIVSEEAYDAACDVLKKTPGRRSDYMVKVPELLGMDIEVKKDDLATMLTVAHPIARRYFDYILRYKMADVDEVRDYRYALAKNGFQSEGLWLGYLNMNRAGGYCLGINALEYAKAQFTTKKAELERELDTIKQKIIMYDDAVAELGGDIENITILLDTVDLDIAARKEAADKAVAMEQEKYDALDEMHKNDPDYNECLAAQERAQIQYERISEVYEKIREQIREHERSRDMANRDATECSDLLNGDGTDEHPGLEYELEMAKKENPEEAERAIREYDEFLRTGNDDLDVIEPRTYSDYKGRMGKAENALVMEQSVYGAQFHRFDTGYEAMDQYRARLQRIKTADMDKAMKQFSDAKKEYDLIFKNQFISEIRSRVDNAMELMKRLNRGLRKLNFSTTYRFEFKELDDGSNFAKILSYGNVLKKVSKAHLLSGQESMAGASIKAEEAASEAEISEMIEEIISDGEFDAYEDYRNYMTYDVKLSGPDYPKEASLVRQIGSNSGAGKQIPYTMIMIASLLNTYSTPNASVKLIMFDEAFGKLDSANAKKVIDFVEEIGLQAVYVAGGRLGDIGECCNTVISVVNQGKHDMRTGVVKFEGEYVR